MSFPPLARAMKNCVAVNELVPRKQWTVGCIYIDNRTKSDEMRILHISDIGLPDPRVERMALTMKDEGHELVFLGGKEIRGQHLDAFSDTRFIPLGIGPRIAHDPLIKRRWLKAIQKVNPDVIHAHNVIVGHFLLDTDYPAIFDDHENLSRQRFVFMSRSFLRRNVSRVILRKIPEWERDMARRYPVLVTSPGAATLYDDYTSRVGVVNNKPFLREVEWLQSPSNRKGLVYQGTDFSERKFSPMRDMTGLDRLLSFDIVAGLPEREMMMTLARYRIGLMPYLPHPFQLICNPNKGYEYLHAGLQVVVNRNYANLFEDNQYVHLFSDYGDIVEVVESVRDVPGAEIMSLARRKYIWDKSVDIVKEAYRQA